MKIKIITKEREVLNTEAVRILLPGANGQMEILPGHTRLVSLLENGEIQYSTADKSDHLLINSGCVEVDNDNVTVLAG